VELLPPGPVPLTVPRVQQYVWSRYVQFETPAFEVDEDEGLALLEKHYAGRPMRTDSECFYYGILAYERSFANEQLRLLYMRKALEAFDAYHHQVTPDFKWEPVEDRYAHVVDTLWPDLPKPSR
jgi:hypothetical protein